MQDTDIKGIFDAEHVYGMDFGIQLCRACLADKNLQSLFLERKDYSESENIILNMFISCTTLDVSQNDQYPKFICSNCLQELYSAYGFWKKCRNALDELNRVREKILNVYIKEEVNVFDSHGRKLNHEKTDDDKKVSLGTNKYDHCSDYTESNNDYNIDDNVSKSEYVLKQTNNVEDKSYKENFKELKEHLCVKCKQGFNKKSALKLHMKVHSGTSDKISSVSSCLCQICGCILMSSRNLEEHIESHSNLRKYKCKICSKAYKTKKTLYTHNLIHAEEKKHTCEHCGQKFRVSASLKCHIKRCHSNAKPYVCKICSKAFKFSYKLTIHIRQHTGEKPYTCNECSMAFVCSSRLKMHMLKHTGIRNYSCTICDKRFLQPQHLKTHMITHTGECKYKCKICEKAFRYSQMLKNHMKVHAEPVLVGAKVFQLE